MGFDTLPPWLANSWFENPAVGYSEVQLTGTNPQKVLTANPMRVGVFFGITAAAIGVTSVAPSNKLTANGGFILTTNAAPLPFLHKDWGPVVAAEWFANGSAGQILVVQEILLRDWPEPDPHDNMDVRDYLDYIAEFIKSMRSQPLRDGNDGAVPNTNIRSN